MSSFSHKSCLGRSGILLYILYKGASYCMAVVRTKRKCQQLNCMRMDCWKTGQKEKEATTLSVIQWMHFIFNFAIYKFCSINRQIFVANMLKGSHTHTHTHAGRLFSFQSVNTYAFESYSIAWHSGLCSYACVCVLHALLYISLAFSWFQFDSACFSWIHWKYLIGYQYFNYDAICHNNPRYVAMKFCSVLSF